MTVSSPTFEISAVAPPASTASQVWRRFWRNKAAAVGLIFILFQIFVAVFAPWVAPHDPYAGDFTATWQLPSRTYLLGTDDLGRDVLSRIIYGARISIAVGILSQLVIVVIGLPIGALAGLLGGWFDFVVMRIVDILSSLPIMLFYILLLVALGGGFGNIILAMAVTGWIGIARLVRGKCSRSRSATLCERRAPWGRMRARSCSPISSATR